MDSRGRRTAVGGGQPWAADGFIFALFPKVFAPFFPTICSPHPHGNSRDIEILKIGSPGGNNMYIFSGDPSVPHGTHPISEKGKHRTQMFILSKTPAVFRKSEDYKTKTEKETTPGRPRGSLLWGKPPMGIPDFFLGWDS